MKFIPTDPPRRFTVGRLAPIELKDCGRVALDPDEQVTFVTEAGGEYDVARKSWGFYATPSLNRRLPSFGLKPALVGSPDGRRYVFLIERGREDEFSRYAASENLRVIRWLDSDQALAAIEPEGGGGALTCLCGGSQFSLVFRYDRPPAGETQFPGSAGQPYSRDVFRCDQCGHFVSTSLLDSKALYGGAYVDATYDGASGIRRAYERIMALPPGESDNAGRVKRVLEFAGAYFAPSGLGGRPPKVLDVGSGLGVFLARMKEAGWSCTALDPDERAVEHARDTVGVEALAGDFMTVPALSRFDAVTFNKVLEHVPDPIAMLAKARSHLEPSGFVYLELPDGEAAAQDGPEREEFFIEHFHVFSPASAAVLASRAGFDLLRLGRIREPSRKYTLYAFLIPHSS